MTEITEEKTVNAETAAPAQPSASPQPPTVPPQSRKTHEAKKKRKKIIKTIIVLLIVAAIAAATVYLLRKYIFVEEPKGEIMTAMVQRSSIQSMVEGSGSTRALNSATISPEQGGSVLELYVKEGDQVVEGQPLYRMDDTDARDAVNKAQTEVNDIQAQLDDIYDSAKDLTIVAPHDGQMLKVADIKVGDDVKTGTAIATIVDSTKLKLSLYFSYVYENDISVGQTCQVSIPSTMATLDGTVETINKVRRVVPEGSVLFEVIVVVKNPSTLTADMAATATLTAGSGEAVYPYESGRLEYYQTSEVLAKVDGPVEQLNLLNYGDVKKGQLLVQLGAKNNDKQINDKKESLKTAQKALDDALKKLGNFNAVSPIDGTVLICGIREGQKVEANQVINVADTSVMTVQIDVDERNIRDVTPGMMVNLDQWGNMYMGTVDSVGATANAQNGVATFPVMVKVDNMDGTLMSNTYIQYSFVASQSENCLVVPVQSVQYVSFTSTGGEPGAEGDGSMVEGEVAMPEGGDAVPEGDAAVPEDDGAAAPTVDADAAGMSCTGGFTTRNLMAVSMPAGGGFVSFDGSGDGGGVQGGETGTIVYVQGGGEKFDQPPEGAIEPDPTWEVPEGYFPVPVTLGLADTMNVEITSGLTEGQTVFVSYMKQNGNNYG